MTKIKIITVKRINPPIAHRAVLSVGSALGV